MSINKGFSLITTLALSLIFSIMGLGLYMISDESIKVTESQINRSIADVNALSGLNAGINHLKNGGSCHGTLSGSDNGGSWNTRFERVGNFCFIISEGEYDSGHSYKLAYLNLSGGNTGLLGGLTFNYFTGSYFRLINDSKIEGEDECAPLAYYDCGDVCENIERFKRNGQIEGEPIQLNSEINIQELLFREDYNYDNLKSYLRDLYENEFNNINLPSPRVTNPDELPSDCIALGVNRCEIKWNDNTVLDCGNKEINTSNCSTVYIGGYNINIDFWNGNIISEEIIIDGYNIRFDAGNSEINGSIYIIADNSISRFELNNTTNINGNVVLRGIRVEQIRMVNDSQINGGLYVFSGIENTALNISNNSGIAENIYLNVNNASIRLVNNAHVGRDIYINANQDVNLHIPNNGTVEGRIVAYAENSLHFEGVNSSQVGSGERMNIILAGNELEIELTNRSAQENIGYVAVLNADGVMHIRLTNRTSLKGLFLSDNMEVDLVNNTELKGILLTKNMDEIRMPNNAEIEGLIAILNSIRRIELVNDAKLEGIVIIDELGRLRLTNDAEIEADIEEVTEMISEFSLANIFNELSCGNNEGGSGGNQITFVIPPTSPF